MSFKNSIRFIFLFLPFLFKAQTYPFSNYGVQDGLPQSNISAIIQDKQGYFWLGTESGLARFDGKNFMNYTSENGLADNNVSALLQDSKGNIWIGHESGKLSKYDGASFISSKAATLPKDKKIYSLFEDKNGSIWICTKTFGAIQLIDPAKNFDAEENYKTYASADGLSQYVFSASQDKQGNLWFLTDIGIKYLDAATKKFEFFRSEGMPFGQITSFLIDSENNFVIGTSNGTISKYDQGKKQFKLLFDPRTFSKPGAAVANNFVYTLFEDSKKNIWASIFNYGVCRYDPLKNRAVLFNTNNGLAVNTIKSITEDREGNILLGTLGEGLQVFKGEKFVSWSKKNGLVNNQVWAVCQDKEGKFWFGTNEGISIYDPKEKDGDKQLKNIPILEGSQVNSVRALTCDNDGDIWIGTWGGKVLKYQVNASKFISIPQLNEFTNAFVSSLTVDKNNKLWIGTIDGVAVYDLKNGNIKNYRSIDGLSDNDVTALFEDSKGKIWIGTKQKGVSVFDGSNFKKLNQENGLSFSSITSFAEDKKGNIWIGSEGGGAFEYNGSVFTKHRTENGLISDLINQITLDNNGDIWMGTNKGLSKWEVASGNIINYSKNDGFTAIETKARASYKDNEGNLWFGTVNGVFKYSPKLDVLNSIEPSLQISRFRVNQKDYPVAGEIELSYKENTVSFDFIGISLSNPDEVKYLVKLEGYENEWRPASKQHFETYSNLRHGKYTFKVMACNGRGVCTKAPLVVYFTITPPFWKTWWFYILVGLISITIIYSYIKIRERALINEKKILEEKVRERTAEVVEKNIELDEKNKDITASIRYAKRIQDAILPPDEFVRTYLPKTFILFKPKDIVSGDFYWLHDTKDKILFAAVDCTGHGVPGAFMSIVGHSKLDQIVGEQGFTKPSDILNELNKSVSDTLRQSHIEDNAVKDGMDISLCAFDRNTNVMEYAGAYNPFWLIRKGELIEIKADKFPIGNLKKGEKRSFTNHSVQLEPGDTIYVFSDGYADQFGGVEGKKFKYSSFKKILMDNQHLSMEEQGELLNKTINDWRGSLEQVDDILVIGTRL